jgi:hypothetical protein
MVNLFILACLKTYVMFKKPHHTEYHLHSSIDAFRTTEFRVFHAAPFFVVNIYAEARWHRRHLKKLHYYLDHPHKYHEDHHGRDPRLFPHYFQEHVVQSVPFHEQLLHEHDARKSFISSVMSRFMYGRLQRVTKKWGGCPEYFVYDKQKKRFFFVIERSTPENLHWRALVKDKYKLCDVVVLDVLK